MEESKGKEFIFTWVIENYSFFDMGNKKVITSPHFIADKMEKSKWSVQLCLEGYTYENYLAVFLQKEKNVQFSHKVNVEFQAIAVDRVLKTMTVNNHLFHYDLVPGFSKFLHTDIIKNDRDIYLPHDTLTLRCRLWYPNTKILEAGQCFARTRMGVERMCFVWDLVEFSILQPDLKKTFPITAASGEIPLKSMNLFWTKTCPSEEMNVEIALRANENIACKCKLSILGFEGKVIDLVRNERHFMADENTQIWILPPLFSKNHLMARKGAYLTNDTLSLKCEFAFSTGIVSEKIEETYIGPKIHHSVDKDFHNVNYPNFDKVFVESMKDLKCDLESLYTESINCDVNLRVDSESTMEESKGKEFIFTWVVQNFSFFNQRYREVIESPNFIAVNMKKSKWIVRLFPGGWSNENYLAVYLRCENDDPFSHKVNYELQVIAIDAVLKTSREFNHLFEKKNLGKGFFLFLHRDENGINDRDAFLPHDTFTLLCRLWYPDTEILESGQCFARTRMGVERMCFAWDLVEFSTLQPDLKKTFPITAASGEIPLKSMNLFWTKTCSSEEMNVEIALRANENIACKCKLSILGFEGKVIDLVRNERHFIADENTQIWILPPLFSKNHLMARKGAYLTNDTLSLKCEFAFSTGIVSEKIEETYIGPKIHHSVDKDFHNVNYPNFDKVFVESMKDLKCDLESLYTESINCDVNLRVDSEHLYACYNAG
ncbi:speckle-type POZ protein B [Caerostris darwini]|uniref:Speckle-type POZ protein B n=1 Tax=Caerostris darwini TaxID=1538125 RepID=A0AAV4STN7_9ARAC|nr:speckle-type POZ protein B [Caerostris darwini]